MSQLQEPVFSYDWIKIGAQSATAIIAIIGLFGDFRPFKVRAGDSASTAPTESKEKLPRSKRFLAWSLLTLVAFTATYSVTSEFKDQLAKFQSSKALAKATATLIYKADSASDELDDLRITSGQIDQSTRDIKDSTATLYDKQQSTLTSIDNTSDRLSVVDRQQRKTLDELNRSINPFTNLGIELVSEFPFSYSKVYPGDKAPWWPDQATYSNSEALAHWLERVRKMATARIKEHEDSRLLFEDNATITVDRDGTLASVKFIGKSSPYFPNDEDFPDAYFLKNDFTYSLITINLFSKGRALDDLPSRRIVSTDFRAAIILDIDFDRNVVTRTIIDDHCEEEAAGGDIQSIFDLPGSKIQVVGIPISSRLMELKLRYGIAANKTLSIDTRQFPLPSIDQIGISKRLDASDFKGLESVLRTQGG